VSLVSFSLNNTCNTSIKVTKFRVKFTVDTDSNVALVSPEILIEYVVRDDAILAFKGEAVGVTQILSCYGNGA
jgi:hypothetical protein